MVSRVELIGTNSIDTSGEIRALWATRNEPWHTSHVYYLALIQYAKGTEILRFKREIGKKLHDYTHTCVFPDPVSICHSSGQIRDASSTG